MDEPAFTARRPPEVRALADRVRRFLKETVPEAQETIYKGATAAGYRTRACGTFCGLFTSKAGVHLYFSRGADLPDPDGLLRGGGEGYRYLVLRPDRPFPEDALFHLVVAALLIGTDRGGPPP